MVYRFLSSLVFFIFAVFMFVFSVSNKDIAIVKFWGLDGQIELPLYLLVLLISFFSFLIGIMFSRMSVMMLSVKVMRGKVRNNNLSKKVEELEEKLKEDGKSIDKLSGKEVLKEKINMLKDFKNKVKGLSKKNKYNKKK